MDAFLNILAQCVLMYLLYFIILSWVYTLQLYFHPKTQFQQWIPAFHKVLGCAPYCAYAILTTCQKVVSRRFGSYWMTAYHIDLYAAKTIKPITRRSQRTVMVDRKWGMRVNTRKCRDSYTHIWNRDPKGRRDAQTQSVKNPLPQSLSRGLTHRKTAKWTYSQIYSDENKIIEVVKQLRLFGYVTRHPPQCFVA